MMCLYFNVIYRCKVMVDCGVSGFDVPDLDDVVFDVN